jgi:hypothetical protein|tara:strand:- start:1197 stop:2147 length:951 start_codon:yes stop_codon:yes gene_type:complete
MKKSMVSNIFNFPVHKEQKGDVKVSYSQYTMWANCPKQWKLTYMDGHKDFDPSIHLVFGTAMHETIQSWLQVMYNESAVKANEMDLESLLLEEMAKEYKKMMAVYGVKFTTKDQMNEFYDDGVQILDFLRKNRASYFSTRTMKLVGVELPIYYPASDSNENIMMKGFLDLVFENLADNTIEIWDIKTSTKGWNKWQKADKTKTAQLVLYKKFFAEQYGYPLDKIQVRYFIVKRKLWEEAMFAQKRVQEFVPSHGKPTLNKIVKSFDEFIANAFNDDGSYNTEGDFPATMGKNKKSCKYCPFKDSELCPKVERIKFV